MLLRGGRPRNTRFMCCLGPGERPPLPDQGTAGTDDPEGDQALLRNGKTPRVAGVYAPGVNQVYVRVKATQLFGCGAAGFRACPSDG